MRYILAMLALLAGFKVWYQNDLYRQAADQAVAVAFRERAAAACQRQQAAARVNWASPSRFALTAGNHALAVQLWQVDHAQWNTRFKSPHLVLTAAAPNESLTCAYDITAGSASLANS